MKKAIVTIVVMAGLLFAGTVSLNSKNTEILELKRDVAELKKEQMYLRLTLAVHSDILTALVNEREEPKPRVIDRNIFIQ